MEFTLIDSLQSAMRERHYIAERGLATSLTRSIQAALLNIDHFLPVHNLASLEDLADRLSDLDQRSHGGTDYARYFA